MSQPSFVAVMQPEFRSGFLDGSKTTVTFDGDRLKLRGEGSPDLDIQIGSITEMRAKVTTDKLQRFLYSFTLVVGGQEMPFHTLPSEGDPAYAAVVRALAAALLTRRIPVSTGMSWAISIIYMFTLGAGFVVAAIMSILLADDEELYLAPLGVLGVITVGSVTIGQWLWRRIIPRPIRTIADLDRALPGC